MLISVRNFVHGKITILDAEKDNERYVTDNTTSFKQIIKVGMPIVWSTGFCIKDGVIKGFGQNNSIILDGETLNVSNIIYLGIDKRGH